MKDNKIITENYEKSNSKKYDNPIPKPKINPPAQMTKKESSKKDKLKDAIRIIQKELKKCKNIDSISISRKEVNIEDEDIIYGPFTASKATKKLLEN